jgi:hypothetical protein
MAVVRHFALNLVRTAKDKRSIKLRRKLQQIAGQLRHPLLHSYMGGGGMNAWSLFDRLA